MSDELPLPDDFRGPARLFPLPNVVLFPGALLPLHVFEPRYRRLTADALADDRLIAPVLLRPGWEAGYEGRPAVYPVACLGRIVAEDCLKDGRYNLLLHGLRRFRIVDELAEDQLYRRARVELLRDTGVIPTMAAELLRDELVRAVAAWLGTVGMVSETLGTLLELDLPLGKLADLVGFVLPLDPELKQGLLEELDIEQRVRRLIRQLQTALPSSSAASEPRAFPPEFSPN